MSATSRQAYHTHVKLLVRNESLPAEIRRQIPRSNLHRWRREKADKYCTLGIVQKDDALTHAFAAYKGARKIFSAYVRHIKIFVSIEEALQHVNKNINPITLITDSGPENNLKAFLSTLDQPIEQCVALVDVAYSNSLIEAHNKIIKYNYLYKMNIADGDQLRKIFPTINDDFNNRPHVSLGGLTPNEAEQNKSLDREKLKRHMHRATEERKIYNKTHQCKACKG